MRRLIFSLISIRRVLWLLLLVHTCEKYGSPWSTEYDSVPVSTSSVRERFGINPNWILPSQTEEHFLDQIPDADAQRNEKSTKPFLVFSHFNENLDHLSWVKEYPHLIYNRGEYITEEEQNHLTHISSGMGKAVSEDRVSTTREKVSHSFNVVHEYSNVGREAFIYLLFIIRNYNRLPHRIIFAQTNQVDKSIFNFNDDDFHQLVVDIAQGKVNLKPENDGFAYLVPKCFGFWYGIVNPVAHKTFPGYFKDIIHESLEGTRFQPFGAFMVEKEVILRRPIGYYKQLIETLNQENDPVIGHFFEHAWSQILHSNCSQSKEYFCGLDNLPEKC